MQGGIFVALFAQVRQNIHTLISYDFPDLITPILLCSTNLKRYKINTVAPQAFQNTLNWIFLAQNDCRYGRVEV